MPWIMLAAAGVTVAAVVTDVAFILWMLTRVASGEFE
jgi:hypothetical protein